MDFEEEIIEKSKEKPILVDFWASWCGPCLTLGPILEDLEKTHNKWTLIKVNVDENSEVSGALGIRGIPDVRLYSQGKEVARFTGALPKHQVEKWLEEHLPDERSSSFDQLVRIVDDAKRKHEIENFVETHPDFRPGLLALAKLIVNDDPNKARQLVQSILPMDKLAVEAEAIKDMSVLMEIDNTNDSPVEKKLLEAKSELKNKNEEAGIQLLIDAVSINKNYRDDLPRKAAIAFFILKGNDHGLTKTYRKKFDMALY